MCPRNNPFKQKADAQAAALASPPSVMPNVPNEPTADPLVMPLVVGASQERPSNAHRPAGPGRPPSGKDIVTVSISLEKRHISQIEDFIYSNRAAEKLNRSEVIRRALDIFLSS